MGKAPALRLDAVDLKILRVLQCDGRITKVGLAEAVNLSPSPCWERLKRLEQAGIIKGYQARLDAAKVARFAEVLVEVTLQRHRQEDFARFEQAMRETPEVLDCWATGGGVDYLLRVVAPDIDAYQRLIDRLLEAEIGIDRYFTYIVTRSVKSQAPLPLERLLGEAEPPAGS